MLDTYVSQLTDQHSDASRHLARMTTAIRELERSDQAFLARNYAIDSDYFDLQPIGRPID